MTETEYARVCFAGLTPVWGFRVNVLSARDGVRIVRVREDGRDDLVLTKPGKPKAEVPWSRVSFAEPKADSKAAASTVAKVGRKRAPAEAE